jgi:dual-specificity kinase
MRSRSRSRGSYSRSSSEYSEGSGGSAQSEIIHFDWHKGLYMNRGRYEVRDKLGDGTFGRVLQCNDSKYRDTVAIKVIRDVPRYIENAQIEAKILRRLFDNREKREHPGRKSVVRLHDTFFHRERYYCLVFEPLGMSLYDLLKRNDYIGMYMSDIQLIAHACIEALDFCHSCNLVHTDIKAENILLVSNRLDLADPPSSANRTASRYFRPRLSPKPGGSVKLIDFGNGTFPEDHAAKIINTRQYRSPEVLLDLGWDKRSDIWSIACVLAELYLGELLFETHEDSEHLALIEKMIGSIPQSMLELASTGSSRKLVTRDRGGWAIDFPRPPVSESSVRAVRDATPVSELFNGYSDFTHLIGAMLEIRVETRISTDDALRHPFFTSRRD